MIKIGRNDPCHCGSGKKYKQCCLQREEGRLESQHANSPKAIQTALEYFNGGRLSQAEALCQQVLQQEPNHPDALHLLGLIAHQAGKSDAAVELINRAIRISQTNHVFYNNLATIYSALNRSDEAVACCKHSLAFKPDYAPAYNNLGNLLSSQGKPDEAMACYQKVLALKPDYAPAYYNLGAILNDQGKLDEAVACYQRALALKPDYAEAHSNLGNTLNTQGKLDEAVACYQRALALKPDYAEAHSNLGNTLNTQGRLDEAVACYQAALELKPGDAEAHYNLGNTLNTQGKLDEAVACYQTALALKPTNVEALNNLGGALTKLGRLQEAVQAYRLADEIKPSGHFKHLLAMLQGLRTERAPDEYVQSLFDNYADRFDSHLLQDLSYRMPALLKQTLMQYAAPQTGWDILDLGCGTGLFGAEICGVARTLVGVDLSAKMLDKASQKNLYQRLVQAELLSMMADEPGENYDLVAATDVFIYVGKLDGVVLEASRLLRQGGYFAFTVESLDAVGNAGAQDYVLNQKGRYVHAQDYLASLRAACGFQQMAQIEAQIRLESGKPVLGWLVVWRKGMPQALAL